jgi:hypothetical protein
MTAAVTLVMRGCSEIWHGAVIVNSGFVLVNLCIAEGNMYVQNINGRGKENGPAYK